jgi:hypothetical protein
MRVRLTDNEGRTLMRGETEDGVSVHDLLRTSCKGKLNFSVETDEDADVVAAAAPEGGSKDGKSRRGAGAQ